MRSPAPALLLVAALAGPAAAQQSTTPTFVQGAAFSSASRVSTVTVTLTAPVGHGDLLVGWFSQFDAPEQVRVSDDVNGTWTRVPGSLTFMSDTGDIALYYRENSQAAPGGMTITVSVSSTAYLQGTVAEYSGVAPAGSPGSVTPGSSLGVAYTPRAQTANGSAYEEDITSSAAGGQQGTATLAFATDWYAVCAVFHPLPATPPGAPSTPTGLEATSLASTRVTLSWSPSTGSVAGYTLYRDGSPIAILFLNGPSIGRARPDPTTFVDEDVTPLSTYTYTVDAFDLADEHSAQSAPLRIITPVASPEFVQGVAGSSASRIASETLVLTEPVLPGDLLVGWFGQFDAPGEVHVLDNVNGPWTRSVSTTFGGTGDIALFYRRSSFPAPFGLVITVSASAPAYLQEAVADYRNVAVLGTLDQALVAQGVGTNASAGPTAAIPAGELVVAAVITGGQPAWAIPGSSQMVPYVLEVQNGSASSDIEDILSSAAGPQEASMTLGTATNWYMVLATFRPLLGVGPI